MTILNAALAVSVQARIQELESQVAKADESLELLRDRDYSRGIFVGHKSTLQAEIRFLTELHLALTNTMKKAAENPHPAPGAEPDQ